MSATYSQSPDRSVDTTAARDRERGVALVMALIFSILLYILVAELVVSSRMVRATGENDALLARMRSQMQYQLSEAEDKLLSDLVTEEEGGEDPGGAGGLGAGPGGAIVEAPLQPLPVAGFGISTHALSLTQHPPWT